MALTLVYGTIIATDGTPVPAVNIRASLNAAEPVVTSSGMVMSEVTTAVTNASGAWSLELIPNDQITSPKETTYTFQFTAPAAAPVIQPFYAYATTIQAHGASFSKIVTITSAASAVDFDTLV